MKIGLLQVAVGLVVVVTGAAGGWLLSESRAHSPASVPNEQTVPAGFESFGKQIPGECLHAFYFDTAERETLTLDWVAAAFSPEHVGGQQEMHSALEESDWNQRNLRGGTVHIPLAPLKEETGTVPRASFERTLSIHHRAGNLRLLTPSPALVASYPHGLVLSLIYLEDGSREGEGFGWMLGFRAPDRDPFPGGESDPEAACPEPAFTIAGGSLVREVADDDAYRFHLDGVDYAVVTFAGAHISADQIASLLDGR